MSKKGHRKVLNADFFLLEKETVSCIREREPSDISSVEVRIIFSYIAKYIFILRVRNNSYFCALLTWTYVNHDFLICPEVY